MQRQVIFSIDDSIQNSIPEVPVVEPNNPKNICSKLFCCLKNCTVEYCSISSISGFIHLTSFGVLHRIFWFILLVASAIACYFTNVRLLGAREVLILHEDNTISTSEIPFPAVTVCTTIKADHRKFNYRVAGDRPDNLTREESIARYILSRILLTKDLGYVAFGHRNDEQLPFYLEHVESRIYELGIKEEDLIASCSFNKIPCNWSKVLTPDGLCYAFNLIDPEEMFHQNIHEQYFAKGIRTKGWSYKHGYENNFKTDVYPLRALAANQNNELKMRLQTNLNDLGNSNEDLYFEHGFTIYVGHPIDYPYHHENRVFIPSNVHFVLNISPDMILTDKQLKYYPLKARKCFIDDKELKHLKIFKKYSVNNCQMECIAKISTKNCHCIQYFVPSLSNTTCGSDPSHTTYCHQNGVAGEFFKETIQVDALDAHKKQCNCIPPCASLTYTAHETLIGIVPNTNETYNFSDVTVRFSAPDFLPKRRQESYSNLDLLSAVGANLGLFVGASVTSIIELVYYFTIKLCLKLFSIKE